MSTVTAILEPEPDGTLHLPVPEALRHGKIEVIATLRSLEEKTLPSNEVQEGILDRLRKTIDLLGPIPQEDGIPEVWTAREGCKPDPLES